MKSISKFQFRSAAMAISLMFFIALFTDCGKSDSNPSMASNAVSMKNTQFVPPTITVPAHTTVTWTNGDGFAHTVTSDNGLFNSGNVNGGGSFSFKFDTAGTYTYHCTIHAGMTGKVVVQ
jgi:plastocyanin